MELRETRERAAWRVEMVEGGRSVSRLWVCDRVMRIGRAEVRIGGIGGVGTEPSCRRRGLARQVLGAAGHLMAREGYDASFLFGIHDFYHRFGYATCMPEYDLRLETRAAEQAVPRLRLRPLRRGDLPGLLRVYEGDNRERTGSVVRPAGWEGFAMGSGWFVPPRVRVAVDGKDRVRGYVVYDGVDDRSRAAEVGGAGAEVLGSLLSFLARRAVARRCGEVTACVPPDHPFAGYARGLGCRSEVRCPRNGGPMGRIVRLGPFLASILPELERRWGAPVTGAPLGIRTDVGSATLTPERGRLRLVVGRSAAGGMRVSQDALMQLCLGYHGPEDLIAAGRLELPAARLELAGRLFPRQCAHMWWPDRF